MSDQIGNLLLGDIRREFANQRTLADRAIAQLTSAELFRPLDQEGNSVAIIMKHIGGNLRSRWTDFLTTDGEKPDRNRDGEFEGAADTPESIAATWRVGWDALESSLTSLRSDNLLANVFIRGEAVSVIQALNRSLAHTAQHVGQIILVAKHLRGAAWQTLSIPRGKSDEFRTRPPSSRSPET